MNMLNGDKIKINDGRELKMKTRKEIIAKINEYYKLASPTLRDIGFLDALRWDIEEQEAQK